MSSYLRNAVAFDDLKNAALYFDHLVPVYVVTEFARKSSEWKSFCNDILWGLLPPALVTRPDFLDAFADVNRKTSNSFKKLAAAQYNLEPNFQDLSQEEYDRIEEASAQAYFSFIEQFGLGHWPIAGEGDAATAAMPDNEMDEALPLLTLSRLRLVDASTVSWEHVLELRKDTVAQDRLRRLRLFAFQNYSGKSREFIEDDLLSRVADYEASAKKWGLETVQGTLSLVLNSKLAAGAFAGSLVSALFGAPMAALLAGTAGAVLEVSNVALELRRRKMTLDQLSRDNPVSYISYARILIDGEDAC